MKLQWKLILASIALITTALSAQTGALAAEGSSSNLAVTAKVGIGYDTNVFRSPDVTYVDLSKAGNPLTLPNVQAGIFIPMGFDARYVSDSFIATYRFDGDLYPNRSLSNADIYDHKFDIGRKLEQPAKWLGVDDFYAGLTLKYHRQTYVDRDTGLDFITSGSGTNVSQRFNYLGLGTKVKLTKKTDMATYHARFSFERRFYSDPVVISVWDHNYFILGGDARFHIGHRTALKLSYDFSIRDFSNRPSHSANGRLTRKNPTVTYYYHAPEVTLSHRFSKALVTFLSYGRTYRQDTFVGYNDYRRDKVRWRTAYSPSKNVKMRLALSYRKRVYDNAFAFDNPVAGAGSKDFNIYTANARGEFKLGFLPSEHWALWGEVNYRNQASGDTRYDYKRTQVMGGIKWEG
ncbi:MAG: hypothetical protein Q9M24_04235 [Mariprofundaceae bacterium]|nr:hypothetical protein [Mariprofundaceae bacterium]